MPQRFLRPGITTSKKFNRLDWITQSFFIRIITLVDDFGRYEADVFLLRSHCFPRGGPNGEDISCEQVAALRQHLLSSEMVDFYTAPDGKEYLQVLQWQERARAEKSKYPEFDNKCCRLDSKCSPPSPSPSPSPTSSSSPSSSSAIAHKGSALEMTSNGKTTVELMERATQLLGKLEMRTRHSRWYDRATKNPALLDRVLNETANAIKEGRIKTNPGAYAEDTYKRFAE